MCNAQQRDQTLTEFNFLSIIPVFKQRPLILLSSLERESIFVSLLSIFITYAHVHYMHVHYKHVH